MSTNAAITHIASGTSLLLVNAGAGPSPQLDIAPEAGEIGPFANLGLNGPATRLFDIAASLIGILLLLPLFLLIAICIRVSGPGPVFFLHRRMGRFGASFHCVKFRSMVPNAAEILNEHLARCPAAKAEWHRTFKLQDDPRVTRFGRFLRRSSLDELPQLLNVLRGEMSIVGPRPIVDEEIARYGAHFREYCSVRPGLTGSWQISGRCDMPYPERVALDCDYVRGKTLVRDLVIVARTIPAVLSKAGAY